MTMLNISNEEEMNDIMKRVNCLEESSLLIKSVDETIQIKRKTKSWISQKGTTYIRYTFIRKYIGR